jgi:hypothetical protein
MYIGYWWEIKKKGDHKKEEEVGGWIILKRIIER